MCNIEEEEIVNLSEVKNKLEKIEARIEQAKKVHNKYLKELGLKEL